MTDPAGRLLRCAAVLAVACAALYPAPAQAQAFGRNKIQYAGFDWHVLRTDHFDVYYYPEAEALARIGAAEAEAAYDTLSSRFATSLGNRVPIVFYATNLHFKETNITPGFIPDGVGGFFEFLKGRVVIPADGNLGRFRRVIRHEMTHVFTFNRLARVLRDHRTSGETQLPLWFTEGLAEYWSGPPDMQHEMILRDEIASNSFVPLHDLDRIAGTFTMYKEGEAFCRFVSETYGEERLLELIDEAWRDTQFNDVLAYVLGEDADAVSDRWEAYVRAEYLPRLAGADVPSLTAAPITSRGFSRQARRLDAPRRRARGPLLRQPRLVHVDLRAARGQPDGARRRGARGRPWREICRVRGLPPVRVAHGRDAARPARVRHQARRG